MNQQNRLRENRREYQNKFFLGFLGGSGLLSVLFLAIYNFFGGDHSKTRKRMNEKKNKGPEQFEIMGQSSDE